MERSMKELEARVSAIEQRNSRVEADKAWEISIQRKISVAFLTYCVVFVFFSMIRIPNPFVSAIVPTMGYLLSTVSLSFLKKLWIWSHNDEEK